MSKKRQPEQGFEEALKRLEEVLDSLEHGNLNLEDSVKAFEEGVKLVRFCHGRLDEVERRVELLLKDAKGELALDARGRPKTKALSPSEGEEAG